MVTGERVNEVQTLLATLRKWAEGRPEVIAVGLVGSWAHGDARMDSDVDLMLATEDRRPCLGMDAWVRELGGVSVVYDPEGILAGLLEACGRR